TQGRGRLISHADRELLREPQGEIDEVDTEVNQHTAPSQASVLAKVGALLALLIASANLSREFVHAPQPLCGDDALEHAQVGAKAEAIRGHQSCTGLG